MATSVWKGSDVAQPRRIYCRQNPENSLWYVMIEDRKVSVGYKHEATARQFADGFEQGWTMARERVAEVLRTHMEAVAHG